MKRKRPYRATDVKQVPISSLLEGRADLACDVGLDCSKREVLVVVRWTSGEFERPWRVQLQAGELSVMIEKLKALAEDRRCSVALEPTGNYSEPIRHALEVAGFAVYLVPAKASHDYAEILDGVPSQHDGKDAAVVAELCALGKRSRWSDTAQADRVLRHELDWLEQQRVSQSRWLARIEAELARCWPELTGILSLSTRSILTILCHYGGPAALRDDPQATAQLTQLARGLKPALRQRVLQSAQQTWGVPQQEADVAQLKRYAEEAFRHRQTIRKSKARIEKLSAGKPALERMAQVVGIGTAAACWTYLGPPEQYHSSAAYLKAMGLNLKERSSGRYQGQLKISKRGPSRPRRWLYFAALRKTRTGWLKPWYEAKKARSPGGRGMRTIVALMRKLASAVYQVAKHNQPYSDQMLVPGAARYHRSGKSPTQKTKTSSSKRDRKTTSRDQVTVQGRH